MTDTLEQATPTEPITAEQGDTVAPVTDTGAEQGNPQTDTQEVQKTEQDEAKPKRKAGIEQRISELTAKRKEAERRAEEAEKRLAEATAGGGNTGNEAPSLDQFETYDQYVDARAKWIARQEYASAQRETAEAASRSASEARRVVMQESFAAKVEDARERLPDYDSVVFASTSPMTEAMRDAIIESDMSADIAYYLAKHPDVSARLLSLSPMAVAREIGRIEMTITSQPVVAKATSAPDPIRPVGQRPAPIQKAPDEMSESEYWAWRKAQRNQR